MRKGGGFGFFDAGGIPQGFIIDMKIHGTATFFSEKGGKVLEFSKEGMRAILWLTGRDKK